MYLRRDVSYLHMFPVFGVMADRSLSVCVCWLPRPAICFLMFSSMPIAVCVVSLRPYVSLFWPNVGFLQPLMCCHRVSYVLLSPRLVFGVCGLVGDVCVLLLPGMCSLWCMDLCCIPSVFLCVWRIESLCEALIGSQCVCPTL